MKGRFILTSTIMAALLTLSTLQLAANTKKEKHTIQLNKSTFLEKVVNYEENDQEWKYLGDKPAIVDFYADWCIPCKRLAPVLEELAAEYEGRIVIYKVDAMKETELSSAFGISAFPTLIFIPLDKNPQVLEGALPKNELKKIIEEIFGL